MANRNYNNRSKGRNRNSGKNPETVPSENVDHLKFASASAQFTGIKSTSTSSLDESRLKSMLQDPAKNAVTVGNFSKAMKNVSGIYKRIIKYMSSMLTYDHTIYPVMENPFVDVGDVATMQQSFAQTAILLDRLNLKYNMPVFVSKMFTTGTIYMYKLEDSKSVAYQEMPTQYCRVAYMEEGVFRFQMDVTKLTEVTALSYPKEIQTAYNSFKAGNTSSLIEAKYYQVSDKGVAFTIDEDVLSQAGQSLPPLANVLIDAIRIETAKDAMESNAELDNTKIVHSRVPLDDKGRPSMELPVVHEYHSALKRSLPKGSVAVTNPFDTEVYTMNGVGKEGSFSLLDKTVDQLYKGAGVSQQLFANDNSSSNALERSLQVDSQWLYSFVLPLFTNYYNYELKKAGKKGTTWKIKLLTVSHFDRKDAIASAQAQLSNGGSRLEYLAYTGMTPIEVANMLAFEQRVLSIDDYMVVKATSHTTAGSADGKASSPSNPNGAGAPTSDNPSDTTVRIKDQQ